MPASLRLVNRASTPQLSPTTATIACCSSACGAEAVRHTLPNPGCRTRASDPASARRVRLGQHRLDHDPVERLELLEDRGSLHRPFREVSLALVDRGLYHFTQAYYRGAADDVVTYLTTHAKLLGLLKRKRRTTAGTQGDLTTGHDPALAASAANPGEKGATNRCAWSAGKAMAGE